MDSELLTREAKERAKAETLAKIKAPTDSVYVCFDSKKNQYGFVKMKDVKMKIFDKYDTLENHLIDLINDSSLKQAKIVEHEVAIEQLLINVSLLKKALIEVNEKIEKEGDLGL